MARLDKALQIRFDLLNDDQLERKVDELKQTIPQLMEQLDYTSRMLKVRRRDAIKKAIDDARRNRTS